MNRRRSDLFRKLEVRNKDGARAGRFLPWRSEVELTDQKSQLNGSRDYFEINGKVRPRPRPVHTRTQISGYLKHRWYRKYRYRQLRCVN